MQFNLKGVWFYMHLTSDLISLAAVSLHDGCERGVVAGRETTLLPLLTIQRHTLSHRRQLLPIEGHKGTKVNRKPHSLSTHLLHHFLWRDCSIAHYLWNIVLVFVILTTLYQVFLGSIGRYWRLVGTSVRLSRYCRRLTGSSL